jgi:predicted HAD superfamily hydrolase
MALELLHIEYGMQFQNPWLAKAAELIDTGKYRILSLDVFDTLVWRRFPRPTDLFYSVGGAMKDRGWLQDATTPGSFAALREEIEALARQRKIGDNEVTIEEIYQSLPHAFLRDKSPRDAQLLELEIERESTFANQDVLDLVQYARQHGLKVACVSDTYFPDDHMRAILPLTPDYLVTSCDFGTPKTQGLHRALLSQSGVLPEQILHLGDNHEADVVAPERLGIATIEFPKFPAEFTGAIDDELPRDRLARSDLFSGSAGDCGLTSIRSQAVNTHENLGNAYRLWGSLILGPAMAGFCHWMVQRCKDQGITNALFLMREGRLLLRVTRAMFPDFAGSEFFISRYAALNASILHGRTEEILRLVLRPSPSPAGSILEPMEIESSELGLDPETLVDSSLAEDIARTIHQNSSLRTRSVEASRKKRRRLLRHFFSLVPEPPERLAVVDLGYSGTIQGCLQQILDHEGVLTRTHGLYFVTNRGVRILQERGGSAEGYVADQDQPVAVSHSFTRSPEIVEQCLMSDCGTTIGYESDGTPVTGEVRIPSWQEETIREVQTGALSFVDRWADHLKRHTPDHEQLRQLLRSVTIRATASPNEIELKAFGDWQHDENFGSSKTKTLVECSYSEEHLRHMSAHQLASLKSSDVHWIFGLAHEINPLLGQAVRAIYSRQVAPEAFHAPVPGLGLNFFWDDGVLHNTREDVPISSSGAVWHRFSLDFRAAKLLRIGFQTDEHPVPMNLTGASMQLVSPGNPTEKHWLEAASFQSEVEPSQDEPGQLTLGEPCFAPVSNVNEFQGTVHVDVFLNSHNWSVNP